MTHNFSNRHIGPTLPESKDMLQHTNCSSLNELIEQTIPKNIRLTEQLSLPPAISEPTVIKELYDKISHNIKNRSFIGQGYYGCYTPSVIQRNILENPGWYTQYTPYQAEIAQGRLEALLNFQTMVTSLTGMNIANASLLDEATAATEAMIMAWNISKKKNKSSAFLVSSYCFDQTIDVLKTRAKPLGIKVVISNDIEQENLDNYFGILVQYPHKFGGVYSYQNLCQKANQSNTLFIACVDLMSLVLLEPPGTWGADIVIGSSQRFGVPMMCGGPHAAFFATKKQFKRQIPGRIIGISVDKHNRRALRMALQTREQHIRREKATSNICTAQVLLAIMASMYTVYHGPKGLKAITTRIHNLTTNLYTLLNNQNLNLKHNYFFDTLHIELENDAKRQVVQSKALALGYNFLYPANSTGVVISLDETTETKHILKIASCFEVNATKIIPSHHLLGDCARTSSFLEHPVFNQHHSETKMLRYIHRLEKKDLSLNYSMIALGSCTMKLNATTEMIPVSWKKMAYIHPFAPKDQLNGYQLLTQELQKYLGDITGLPHVSLQPNSGAQGEMAGLFAIQQYHLNHQQNRNVILIPSSAHGTNPASASLVGGKVVIVKCNEKGNIDIKDLKEKAQTHQVELSSLMITYPSTHGVFEENILEVCQIIHDKGGLVYMDGANMNAQVGLTSPGKIGVDVCHLNLHKTFCIPHGGGGPGIGPICVNEKLAPYLPSHQQWQTSKNNYSVFTAAPWGSAGILAISWAYIRMMSHQGLVHSTQIAILNANYLMEKLKPHYSILYTNQKGKVAHEFIIDFRDFKKTANIEVEDIAKRLMDYGFHAPTVSFPIPGTLMIEPTESEGKDELDHFCEALIAIRQEIKDIEQGLINKEDNPLKNAPHTELEVINDNWTHPYNRKIAAFPLKSENKFWPSVSRINNGYGDKNLICSCPNIQEYEN